MADITVNAVGGLNKFTDVSTLVTAVDTTSKEALIPMVSDKMLILIQNTDSSNSGTVTIKAGNGIQGNKDISATIPASGYKIVQLESGRFKNVSGDNSGKVKIVGSSNKIKVGAFVLI